MNEDLKQFTQQLADDLKARLASQQVQEFVNQVKASGDDRTFEVVMSTSDEDRQGDALDQKGWDFTFFKLNPVVLWAHDYGGFPIGIVTDIKIDGNQTVATGKFAPEGLNPTADTACALYQQGILKANSPGYIQNDDGTRELLELSFCPVPAGRYALSLRQVQALGLSARELVTKGFFYTTKGPVPYKSHGTADPDTTWDGPAEVKACGDDLDKLKSICAWYDSENADVKSAYKLPHHRASDLKAVWKGVAAAGAVLQGGRGGVDIPEKDVAGVKAHLAKHYEEFGKTPPWEEEKSAKTPQLGDRCELDDGTPGVLAKDPKNPGELICVPPEEGKKSNETQEDMNNELTKALKEEHKRHGDAVAGHVDGLNDKAKKAAKAEGSDNSEYEKAIEEFEEKLESEHDQHLKACMKAIDENYDLQDQTPKKSIDEFKKAVEDEHLKHVKAFDKAIDEFKDAADGDPENHDKAIEQFTEKSDQELDRHLKAHMDLCKEEFGQGQDDGKGEKEMKAGRAISAKNREKIDAIAKAIEEYKASHAADHEEFSNKIIAALKELSGSPEGDEGKEGQDGKSGAPNERPSSSGAKTGGDVSMSELEAYLFGQRLVRQIKSVSEEGLRQFKEKLRDISPERR